MTAVRSCLTQSPFLLPLSFAKQTWQAVPSSSPRFRHRCGQPFQNFGHLGAHEFDWGELKRIAGKCCAQATANGVGVLHLTPSLLRVLPLRGEVRAAVLPRCLTDRGVTANHSAEEALHSHLPPAA